MSAEERSKLETQNAELQAILKPAKKLPLEPAGIKVAAPIEGLVSWVASDRKGLIYLLQRGDQADPLIVVDRNGKIVRSWSTRSS